MEQEKLDLKPSYQRRSDLWPLKYKQLLLNSVLNNYDIPKIYLADFTYISSKLNEERKPYAVIDGKQRFTTFFNFFSDQLRLDETPVFFNGIQLDLGGMSYANLKIKYPQLAERVEEFTPTVMSVITDRFEDVQELFIRLNLNVSISGPERRNAMPGPLPEIIRDLSVHQFFRVCASFPNSRGQDLNATAKFLLMENVRSFAATKRRELDRFVESGKNHDRADFESEAAAVTSTLDSMSTVFVEQDPLTTGQAQLTVYYWLVRTCDPGIRHEIRPFLMFFEEERASARRSANARAKGADIPAPDQSMLRYNTLVRSPDDKAKQEEMFGILDAALKRHLGLSE